MIKQCQCDNNYQDQKYGYKNRVHNICAGTPAEYRCTICERIYKPVVDKKKVINVNNKT